jgi:hypothetical protein
MVPLKLRGLWDNCSQEKIAKYEAQTKRDQIHSPSLQPNLSQRRSEIVDLDQQSEVISDHFASKAPGSR